VSGTGLGSDGQPLSQSGVEDALPHQSDRLHPRRRRPGDRAAHRLLARPGELRAELLRQSPAPRLPAAAERMGARSRSDRL
jgi:hypothetical protein